MQDGGATKEVRMMEFGYVMNRQSESCQIPFIEKTSKLKKGEKERRILRERSSLYTPNPH